MVWSRGAEGVNRWRVWDLPTRLMHWLLALLIAACWWTGTRNHLDYHLYCGYAVLWLVLLRIYWGFTGSSTARFASFVRGPKGIGSYIRTLHRRVSPYVHGHNPLGAISVLLMLALILAVVGLGLLAVDVDGLYSGPLSSYVSFHTGRHIARLHYKTFNWLLAVIALHLTAVTFYHAYKRHNLVIPMITGARTGEPPEKELRIAPAWRLAVGGLLAGALVWLIATGFYF